MFVAGLERSKGPESSYGFKNRSLPGERILHAGNLGTKLVSFFKPKLVYLFSLEVDKVRAETERAVEVRVAIMFVSQLSELLRFFYR